MVIRASTTFGAPVCPGETIVWLVASALHVWGKLVWSQEIAWLISVLPSESEFAGMVKHTIQDDILYFNQFA